MDLGSIIGLIAGMAFIILSIIIVGGSSDLSAAESIGAFLDPASAMLVIGGTVAATLLGHPISRVISALKAMRIVLSPPKIDPTLVISNIIKLANTARKESILGLEEAAKNMDDPFLLKGMIIISEGADSDLMKGILETELTYIEIRHNSARGVYDFMASSAPAWGMLGTFVGLILMLLNLQDVGNLGPSMAVALVTTFYGSIIANYFATPVSNKLKLYSDEEMLIKTIQIEGMLSIANGESARNIEKKLTAFISPATAKQAAGEEGRRAE